MIEKKIQPVVGQSKTEKIKKATTGEDKDRYFEAVGRRKTATARVRLYNRAGSFSINEKDYRQYFPTARLQQMALSPLEKTKLIAKVEVTAKVFGGGVNGQAEAVRHGLSRALVLFDPGLKLAIKSLGFLRRDPRMVERKKFGLKKARRAPQWAKR